MRMLCGVGARQWHEVDGAIAWTRVAGAREEVQYAVRIRMR